MIVMAGNLPPPPAAEVWGWGHYFLGSMELPQAWHLLWILSTWVPNKEITSVSFDRQNGHRALPRSSLPLCGVNLPPPPAGQGGGGGLSTCRHVALFRETPQHLERRLVDAARLSSPADRFPAAPVEPARRSLAVEPFFEEPAQVAHAVRQLSRAMQLVDVRVFRTNPLQRFGPRPLERGAGVHLLHPAPAMQRVIALLLEHLLEPRS